MQYRDVRTDGVLDRVSAQLGEERLCATTGLQQLPFNTLYQLVAAAGTPQLAAARQMLLIPDLITYRLTGAIGAEATNASTTQLYDVRHRVWAKDLAADAGIRPDLLPPLREPGTRVGPVLAEVGLSHPIDVIAVGSHDTASAVVAVPAQGHDFAYISCGTWSLVGVELDAPVLTEASRRANFTNEGGVDGTIRYLRNVMGLWLLQECLRAWGEPDLAGLLRAAADEPALAAVVDADDPPSCRPATCRPASPISAGAPARRRRPGRRPWCGALWTVLPSPTAGPCG